MEKRNGIEQKFRGIWPALGKVVKKDFSERMRG